MLTIHVAYINAQGFPRIGMISIMIGAGLNIVLDQIFIFALDPGMSGAATATIISQALLAAWVLRFLTSRRAVIPRRPGCIRVKKDIIRDIAGIGASNFIMQVTNALVQIVRNSTLQMYGGDLYRKLYGRAGRESAKASLRSTLSDEKRNNAKEVHALW